jgi:hypothetical protein
MLWPKRPSPQLLAECHQRQLLKEWKAAARQTNLELIPCRLLVAHYQGALARQSRSLEATAEAGGGLMDSPPGRRKQLKRIVRRIATVSWSPVVWLSQRPCLQRFKVVLCRQRRRSTVKVLTWFLWLINLHSNFGSRRCSPSSSAKD